MLGINGLWVLGLVCNPPTKKEMKATIPRESIIKSSISLKINFSDHLVLFDKNFS
jgi:hypothetical protein